MMRAVRLYLAGPAGSGKTTEAEMLVRDYGFARISLGGICREEARRRGLPEDRATLQAMGDALRGPEPARLAILAWEQAGQVPGSVVIDGVRLRAEAEWLSARGALGVRVSAPESVRDRAAPAPRRGCRGAAPRDGIRSGDAVGRPVAADERRPHRSPPGDATPDSARPPARRHVAAVPSTSRSPVGRQGEFAQPPLGHGRIVPQLAQCLPPRPHRHVLKVEQAHAAALQ